MFIMTSINSTSLVFMEYENPSEQVVRMEPTLDFENFLQSSVNETTAYGPPVTQNTYWGWTGNLSFTYWDVTENEGIPDANVSSGIWPLSTEVFDLANGTYLIEVNTTDCWGDYSYNLFVEFDKSGFEKQFIIILIHVRSIETDLVVLAPAENLAGDPFHLVIPLGDSIDILFSYNDTEATNDYPGGLEGAYTEGYIGYYIESTLVQHPIELTENGNGFYKFTFDTTDEWLYLSIRETPISHKLYWNHLYVEFTLANSNTQECLIHINIIDIPTELVVDPWVEELTFEPGTNTIFVSLIDLWPTHSGVAIQNLNVTVESSDSSLVEVVSITEDSPEIGVYEIKLDHKVPASVQATILGSGCILSQIIYDQIVLTIKVEKDGYVGQNDLIPANLVAYGGGGWTIPPTILGIPILLVVGVLYIRNKRRIHGIEELPGNE